MRVLPGSEPSLLVTVPVAWCVGWIFTVQLEQAKTHCQHLKGRLASWNLMGFSFKVNPLICHNVTVCEPHKPFSHISSWHQRESQSEKEQILFDFCFYWSRETLSESCFRSSSTSNQTYFALKISKDAFSLLISRAYWSSIRHLPTSTDFIATGISSLPNLGLGTVLTWLEGSKWQAEEGYQFSVI